MTNQRKIQPNTNSNQSYSLLTTLYTREIQKYIINNWFLFLSQLLQKLIPYSFKYLYQYTRRNQSHDNANNRRNQSHDNADKRRNQSHDKRRNQSHDKRRNQSHDKRNTQSRDNADNAIRWIWFW